MKKDTWYPYKCEKAYNMQFCDYLFTLLALWPQVSFYYQNQGITRVIKHKTANANTDIFSL